MNKCFSVRFFASLLLILFTQALYCNVIWPALFVAGGILTTLPLAIISIAIEALLFYRLLKNVSIYKAFLISFVGNIASTLVGTVVTALAAPLTHIWLDLTLFNTMPGFVTMTGMIAEFVFMFLGSYWIELVTIRKIFGYSKTELRFPVFVGNALTYLLTAIYWIIYGHVTGAHPLY